MRNWIKFNLRNIRAKVKEHTLKKQLDLLRQHFLENNKIIYLKNIKVYQVSCKLPYHHENSVFSFKNLKIHITKIQILKSTLHLYVTISKYPLNTYRKYQKVTEEHRLLD